jgi:hypothetical protein
VLQQASPRITATPNRQLPRRGVWLRNMRWFRASHSARAHVQPASRTQAGGATPACARRRAAAAYGTGWCQATLRPARGHRGLSSGSSRPALVRDLALDGSSDRAPHPGALRSLARLIQQLRDCPVDALLVGRRVRARAARPPLVGHAGEGVIPPVLVLCSCLDGYRLVHGPLLVARYLEHLPRQTQAVGSVDDTLGSVEVMGPLAGGWGVGPSCRGWRAPLDGPRRRPAVRRWTCRAPSPVPGGAAA